MGRWGPLPAAAAAGGAEHSHASPPTARWVLLTVVAWHVCKMCVCGTRGCVGDTVRGGTWVRVWHTWVRGGHTVHVGAHGCVCGTCGCGVGTRCVGATLRVWHTWVREGHTWLWGAHGVGGYTVHVGAHGVGGHMWVCVLNGGDRSAHSGT